MLNKNKAYACYSIHESIRLKSSSGGLFYLFAKQILEIKGSGKKRWHGAKTPTGF